MEKLRNETLSKSFWDDRERAQNITQEINDLSEIIRSIKNLEEKAENCKLALEILETEEDKRRNRAFVARTEARIRTKPGKK